MTTTKLEEFLKKELRRFISDVQVTVLIKSPKSLKAYVMGQVMRPGMYSVLDGNPEEARVINFINMAGGFTQFAEASSVKIVRKEGNESRTYTVNFTKIEKDNDISQNMIIQNGDTVIIPQRFNQVYVLGYVMRPGPVPYIEGAKISDYIGSAGGLTKFAASDNIGIIRGDASNPLVIKAKMSSYMSWQLEADDPNVLPGDVIYVPQSWFANWADMSGVIRGFRDSRNAVRDLASPSQWEAK
jgi:protein involved in polysaccharide export with SLBB domain